MRRSVVLMLAGSALLAALPAFAQVNFGTGSSLYITADPATPGPGQTVTLTAQSPLLDLSTSDIEWSVNGSPAGSGLSIEVTLGALGTPTNVSVSVSGASGSDSAEISLTPASIDLLWEAATYAPPLYAGRATATPGSTLRFWAIPHFVENGAAVPSSQIDFTWTVNGAVDKAGSGLGKDTLSTGAAILYGTDAVEVSAQTEDGALSGQASVSIRTGDPQVVLYEDSPLFGVTYDQAFGQSGSVNASEDSFVAVPYFAAVSSPSDPSLSYQWSVNGAPVAATSSNPSEITINAEGPGVAQVELSFSQPSNPFVSGGGSWAISFKGPSSGEDVFTSAPPSL